MSQQKHHILFIYKVIFYTHTSNSSVDKLIFIARETQSKPHQLDVANPETISQAMFVKDRPLVILIHGYTGHKDFSPNTEIRPGKTGTDSL